MISLTPRDMLLALPKEDQPRWESIAGLLTVSRETAMKLSLA